MIIASFHELGLFDLEVTHGCRDYKQARHVLNNDPYVSEQMRAFFAELIKRCNVKVPGNFLHFQAIKHSPSEQIVLANPEKYLVSIINLTEAFIVPAFGTCFYPDLRVATEIETRLVKSSVAFRELIRRTLFVSGVTERSTLDNIPEELVFELRIAIVEHNEACKAYIKADQCNRYTIVTRTLDRLYETMQDPRTSVQAKAYFMTKIDELRASLPIMDLVNYERSRMPALRRG
jgi:hypothetical protein